MFDSTKIFEPKIISGGIKSVALKFPSDQQWADRARAQKQVRQFLGRGKSQTVDADTAAADLQLFKSLRVDDTGTYDASEAQAFLDRLERCEVVSAEWEGDTRRIEMSVPGAKTVHVLRMPMQDQIREHEKSSTKQTFGTRSAEIRVNLEPSGNLYDKVVVSAEGYAGAVPIVHKVAAVTNLMNALSELLAEDADDPLEV